MIMLQVTKFTSPSYAKGEAFFENSLFSKVLVLGFVSNLTLLAVSVSLLQTSVKLMKFMKSKTEAKLTLIKIGPVSQRNFLTVLRAKNEVSFRALFGFP